MPREKQETPETAGQDGKTSRRDLLKRSLIVLGAGAIVQAAGGVRTTFAEEVPRKEDSKIKQSSTTDNGKGKKKKGKGKGGHKGGGTITPDTPKKEGSAF